MNTRKLIFMTICAALMTGCSNAREKLGITKNAPDEFAVTRHAPLEMPASITLPPPRRGQPRPQEQSTTAQAQQAIFGSAPVASSQASAAESILLQQTNAQQVDPNIRATLEDEAQDYRDQNRPVIDKLMGKKDLVTENSAEALDPKLESQRLKKMNIPTTEIPNPSKAEKK